MPNPWLRFALVGLLSSAAALTAQAGSVPPLNWVACGADVYCATLTVPRDYAHPQGPTLELAVVKLPATRPDQRIGPLVINFGGPGGPAVDTLKAIGKAEFATLNERFDLIGVDPRGVGESQPAIDCQTDKAKRKPFTTPLNFDRSAWVADARQYAGACIKANRGILNYVTTANVARDIDRLRAAMGVTQLSYLGFSYGTYLGATYATLFPQRYRAMVLDGAIDAAQYAHDPIASGLTQMAGFEQALGRFFAACAADPLACQGFGGGDPWLAFDLLVAEANHWPLSAHGANPTPVAGDDVLVAASQAVYTKPVWARLARALAAASRGDGTGLRELADIAYGRNPDGTYDPMMDRYFAITAVDQRWPSSTPRYAETGAHAWSSFPRFWWGVGYGDLPHRFYRIAPRNAFHGPFTARTSDPTVLVVGATYDPATPYRDAISLTQQLGNARLLTLLGDGHCAYRLQNSACIETAVEAYLINGALPPEGTTCRQATPFAQPTAQVQGQAAYPDWEDLDFLRVYLRAFR